MQNEKKDEVHREQMLALQRETTSKDKLHDQEVKELKKAHQKEIRGISQQIEDSKDWMR